MTDEQKAILAGMKRAGMTNAQIAARLGTTPRTIKSRAAELRAYKTTKHVAGRFAQWGKRTSERIEDL